MQGNDSYRLVVRRGPQPNQVYELEEDVINLGRDITNDIVINDREVSRHHLRLMRGPDGYTIEDLGSTNGTFVNGKRVTGATLLKNGDMLGLGETVTLGYELVRQDARPDRVGGSPATPPEPTVPQASQQPPADNPYQPPQGYQSYQQSPDPYAPQSDYQAAAGDPYGQQADPYAQQPVGQGYQQADPYGQQQQGYQQQQQYAYGGQQAEQGYYAPQQGQGYMAAPPPPGYDYDPYQIREEEGRSPASIILFGCLGLMVFCCCATIVGAVAVDYFNLYCDVPVLRDVLEALGFLSCVAG